MRWLHEWRLRFRSLFRRGAVEGELADELRFHLEREIERNLARGLTLEEARRRAVVSLGGVEQVKEECRDARGINFLETLWQDVRYAFRMLRKSPGFTLVAVLTLALGIGASVAIFVFVDAALLKPFPYRSPARLVAVSEHNRTVRRTNLSYLDYLDWKRLNSVFDSLDVWNATGYLLETSSGTRAAPGARVSADFFRTLGVSPIFGRDIRPGEDSPGATRTVILSYAAWQKWFGGSRDVLGRATNLSGEDYTIIGVLPRDFQFAPRGIADFWTALQPTDPCEKRRSCHNLWGVARLKDGVSAQVAQANLQTIATRLEQRYPDSNRGQGATVLPLSEVILGAVSPILLTLLAGAGLLLLIACFNVASLLLARSERRRREIAVRAALGASSGRLVRQLSTEALVLVVAGCAVGLLSAAWATQLLLRLIPHGMLADMPYLEGIGLSSRVWIFAVAVSVLAMILLSAAPGLHVCLSDMRAGLIEGGRWSTGTLWRRLGSRLVVLELAVAVVLLVGAGLLGESLYHLLRVQLGFESDHLATLSVGLLDSRYKDNAQIVAFVRQMESRLSTLPGVDAVGLTSNLPASHNGNTLWIRIVGRPYNGEHNEVNFRDISTDYFRALHARLLRGRFFSKADNASGRRTVIINQTLAAKYFPGEDPLGQQIGDTTLSPNSISTIVGVVDDIREGALDSKIWPAIYLPFAQHPYPFFSVVVRTSPPPNSLLPALVSTIRQLDPGAAALHEAAMNDRIESSPTAYFHRSVAWLIGGFAALALLLGVVGLYGVIAYSVTQRYHEFGIRLALGAPSRDLFTLVVGRGLILSLLGVGIGFAGAFAATRFLSSLLFGVSAHDPVTFLAVGALLTLVALAACYVPARRAMRVDPMTALRHE